jgi:uncharacterized protein
VGNTETVQAIYEAFGRGDISVVLDRLSDDIGWDPGLVDHGIPWLKPRRGKAEVAEFFESLQALDFRTFQPLSLLANDNQVAAVIGVEIVVRNTGHTIRDTEVHLWTFDKAGQAVELRHWLDTKQHVDALQG